jgi:transcription antitermination factor NusA-like protein
MATKFEARTESIKVAALSDFFGESDPVWVVRGLTASELARTIEASSKHKSIDQVIKAIGQNDASIAELREALGISDDTPQDIAKRLEQIVIASVEPKIDITNAVKMAECFPVEFYQITNTIVMLTGLGMDVKKLQPSGTVTT